MKDINFLFSESMMEKYESGEKEKKEVSAAKAVLIVLAVLAGVTILFVPGIYVNTLERQVAAVERSLNDAKYTEVRDVKTRLEKIVLSVDSKKAVIKDIDAKSVPASQILLMVEQAIPSGCFFSSVNYSGSSLRISGKADSGTAVAELMGNLDRLHTLTRKTENVQIEQAGSPIDYSVEYMVSEKGGK